MEKSRVMNGRLQYKGKSYDELSLIEKHELNNMFAVLKLKDYKGDVSKELFVEWQNCRRHGDVVRLKEVTGMSQPPITQALNDGIITSHRAVMDITNFFRERLENETREAKRLKETLKYNNKVINKNN